MTDPPRYRSRRSGGIFVAQRREGDWYFVGDSSSRVPNSLWDGRSYLTMDEAMFAAEMEAQKVKQQTEGGAS